MPKKKKGGRGGGVKKRRGWLVVFSRFLQASKGGRLVGMQAGGVMYLPGLQHCHEQPPVCSPVPPGV